MTVGAGLAAQVGIATEGTPGTAAVVTRFARFNTESLMRRPNYVQGQGFPLPADGVPLAARRGEASHDAGGSLEIDLPQIGAGLWLKHCLGSSATAAQIAATTAYQQIHNVGSNDGLTFTCQVGVPSTDGTVNPKTLVGCKITEWELTGEVNALVKLAMTIDAQDILPVAGGALALQTSSYPATGLWNFSHGPVKTASAMTVVSGLWTPTSPASIGVVRKWSLKGGWPKDTARWQAGSQLKAEQLVNDVQPITGSVDVDFASMALYNQHAANTSCVLQIPLSGAAIAGGAGATFALTLVAPAAFLESGSTPQVNGAGVVTVSYPLTFLNDGTNGSFQAALVSTDTSV